MSYITDFEGELIKKLESAENRTSVVRWISEKVLESYKNGVIAGKNSSQRNHKGQNATGVSSPKAE